MIMTTTITICSCTKEVHRSTVQNIDCLEVACTIRGRRTVRNELEALNLTEWKCTIRLASYWTIQL